MGKYDDNHIPTCMFHNDTTLLSRMSPSQLHIEVLGQQMLVNPIQSFANIGEVQSPTLEPQQHMEICPPSHLLGVI